MENPFKLTPWHITCLCNTDRGTHCRRFGKREFEKYINKKLETRHLKVRVIVIPTKRDRLLPGLVEGLGDIAAGNLTITPERQKLVDFADPLIGDIDEIVVTGTNSPKLSHPDDLSGLEIYVRKSSSYYESLVSMNQSFKKVGKPEVVIKETSEYLEDEDILEMVNAGLIPMTGISGTSIRLLVYKETIC